MHMDIGTSIDSDELAEMMAWTAKYCPDKSNIYYVIAHYDETLALINKIKEEELNVKA